MNGQLPKGPLTLDQLSAAIRGLLEYASTHPELKVEIDDRWVDQVGLPLSQVAGAFPHWDDIPTNVRFTGLLQSRVYYP